jgi:pimeloyl-ACP methyl ester carboxylesterase
MVTGRGDALDAQTGGRFDIVGWDPRGAGASAPVSCFADPAERGSLWQDQPVPTTRRDERRYLAKTVELAQRCGARNGELLAHISTTDTVRTWTTCGSWWATAGSPSWASRPGRSSA